jgi:hypothetical protein
MIGKWGTQHLISFSGIESTNPGDCNGIVTVHRHIEDSLYRFGSEKEIVNNTNMYPFHLQCLHFEHMQLAKVYMLLMRIPYEISINVIRQQHFGINPHSLNAKQININQNINNT